MENQASNALGDLDAGYDVRSLERCRALRPRTFDTTLELLDQIDPNFASMWVNYVGGMNRWTTLDQRTSLLVLTGQFTCMKDEVGIGNSVVAAVAAEVPIREILEVILQSAVVAGDTVLNTALPIFWKIAEEKGLIDELRATKLPIDGHDSERSLDSEVTKWDEIDAVDIRRGHLTEKYGWLGISTGLRLRPHHLWDLLEYVDSLDDDFAQVWLEFSYHRMYSRMILDDLTRLLCQAANCIAIGELNQSKAHIRGAMREGASPLQVLEMIIQGIVHLGMPRTFASFKILTAILEEDGRIGELGDLVLADTLQKTVG